MCRRGSCFKTLRLFVVPGSHTYHGKKPLARRQIVIAAREMERKVGQGHSYDLRFSLHASYTYTMIGNTNI